MAMEKGIKRANRGEPMLSSFLNSQGCRLGLPISGNFELTARCNFDCKMCYVHLKNDIEDLKRRELTADQWLSIASDARDMGMIFLLLTGGEPLLREDFPQIYTELVKMGVMVSINTNASLYNEELRQLFLRYPPSRLNVTLYGGCEETYRSLCGNASYERVVNNLRSMREDNLSVRLNVSLTPYNVQDMEKIDTISRELNLQAKAASYMYPPVRVNGMIGENAARFTAEEAGRVMAKWHRLRDTDEMFMRRAGKLRQMEAADMVDTCADVEDEGVLCRAGRSSFWLTWDGCMRPCGTMDIAGAYPLRDGFAKAWEDVRKMTAEIRLPKECTDCHNRNNCGVCAAICGTETGDFHKKPTYLCTMTESQCAEIVRLADMMKGESEK